MLKKHFSRLLISTFALVLTGYSCRSGQGEGKPIPVVYKGALKNMMRKGDISAKAHLNSLKDSSHLYAIGALENLKGEIQIFDGNAFNTSVQGGEIDFDQSFTKKATLLVYAMVDQWTSYPIPNAISTRDQLQNFIKQTARDHGVDIRTPFPFQVKGTVKTLDWHIIDWKTGDTEHSHEKHITSGLHGRLRDQAVELLGFYSDSHHGIFTHHSTNLHVHFKTIDGAIAGHADNYELAPGMTLELPVL